MSGPYLVQIVLLVDDGWRSLAEALGAHIASPIMLRGRERAVGGDGEVGVGEGEMGR